MEAQAILTSSHFIRNELLVAVDTTQDIERKTFYDGQDIKVLLFIVYKIKFKFLISLNTRVRHIRKSSLGIYFSHR